MKCSKCGAEWKQGNNTVTFAKCPFCGGLLKEPLSAKRLALDTVLKQLIEDFGISILQNHKKCISVFKDVAPQLRTEQKALEIALNFGVDTFFINCPVEERKKNVKRAIQAIDFLNEDTQVLIINAFVRVFNWKEVELDKLFDFNNIERKTLKPKQTKEQPKNKDFIKSRQIIATISDNHNVDEKTNVDTTLILNGCIEEEPFQTDVLQELAVNVDGTQQLNNTDDNAEWLFQEGKRYDDAKDYIKAADYYYKAAMQGHAGAQNGLGVLYQLGRGVKQDKAEAVNWYKRAAEQNYAKAQRNLGVMYQYGRGVRQDDAEAVKWYRKAAEQGDGTGQALLGCMYQYGRGITRDDTEAVKWYHKAAMQGRSIAQHNLGYMYERGRGVTKDAIKAQEWYRKAVSTHRRAAELGRADAQNRLGVMYLEGKGVAKDYDAAIAWFL